MNAWELAAEVMIFTLVPLTWVAVSGEVRQRLIAFYMAGVVITLLLMLLTMAFQRMPMMDLALTLALMSFGGGIVFARFLARHL
ncbi:MAG TPA: monovalent cation/H+ antiporter complex subunit F [Candidatus Sulfotelmatobacter sp.]|nr:monovalent cation/H+ antiporter complex subunit F [Candidatus Sulfotelmatobacter sp.]